MSYFLDDDPMTGTVEAPWSGEYRGPYESAYPRAYPENPMLAVLSGTGGAEADTGDDVAATAKGFVLKPLIGDPGSGGLTLTERTGTPLAVGQKQPMTVVTHKPGVSRWLPMQQPLPTQITSLPQYSQMLAQMATVETCFVGAGNKVLLEPPTAACQQVWQALHQVIPKIHHVSFISDYISKHKGLPGWLLPVAGVGLLAGLLLWKRMG